MVHSAFKAVCLVPESRVKVESVALWGDRLLVSVQAQAASTFREPQHFDLSIPYVIKTLESEFLHIMVVESASKTLASSLMKGLIRLLDKIGPALILPLLIASFTMCLIQKAEEWASFRFRKDS